MLQELRWRLRKLIAVFQLPADWGPYRLTWKRLFNLLLCRWELIRLKTVLRSKPSRLVIEPTNVCNLRCPYCHTGAGRFARRPAMMPLDPYLKVLDEIGDYLMLIEVFNWGEAMLHPQLPVIIAAASQRGISTRVNTNFSIPFTAADAERLVQSGLADLFVSVDGATQEVYERYRVGGDLQQVIRNCRLVAATKKRLGKTRPHLTLQFLQFPFNQNEMEELRHLALELDMDFFPVRGAVPNAEWGREYGNPRWWMIHRPNPCPFLWGQPVLTVDGHLAPCRGVFRASDDFTSLTNSNGTAQQPMAQAWNDEHYRVARSLFQHRDGTPEQRRLPCYECPTTIYWERWRAHRRAGGTRASFQPNMEISTNGAWNYFWERGQRAD